MSNSSSYTFQAEVRQLLDIVINALYSDREIFIRELISNASDALEKLRLLQLKNQTVYQADKPLEISISTDEDNHTITIADTGIGMTRDELVENLGTIAHSGTKKLLESLEQADNKSDLIGQFGVGFYSSFMVADRVEVYTHSWDESGESLLWTSDGRESYTIDTVDTLDRGTRIVIHLKKEYEDFAKEYRVRSILVKYSNFVGFPLNFKGDRINTVEAIWLRPKSEVKPEEYDEFYQFIAHTEQKPLTLMHFNADAPIVLNALLFVPDENPEKFGFGRVDHNVALYCHRVLIDAKPEGLLPDWLRFLHGVVDSEDLPLNISREMLQDSSLIRKINDILTNRFLKHLDKLAKDQPETYADFYSRFSRYLKEGIVTSWQHKDPIAKLLRFESTMTEPGKLTSFDSYVSRMKENQKEIYVLTGESREMLENSPYLESFKANGYEVAFFTDHGDQFVLDAINKFGEAEIKSIDRADVTIPETPDTEGEALTADQTKSLQDWLINMYGEKFSKITFGNRLVSGAAVALHGADDMSSEIREYMKAMGQDIPEAHPEIELNPKNELVRKLADLKAEDPELARIVADQITNTALLRAGMLENPADIAKSSQELMEKLLLKK